MKYIFGPVPSRRLGRSLGIDPTVRADGGKACNWNCVYCQPGRTHTFTGSRETLSPSAEVLHELDGALAGEAGKNVDWITFVGSGEPTLSADLGEMLRGVKAMTPLPVAVITNGSLLSLPGVRNDLMVADAVMPTLDAGDELTFLRINRPHPQFGFTRHIDGLVDFRREYHGKIWLETMLISGLNDDEGSLTRLAKAIEKIAK